tara:strand:- start:104 stop:559 length:456 start_codon:yes stop_codon:yes gene_type:complete
MTANAVNGKVASKDPLFVGKDGIKVDFDLIDDEKIYDYILNFGKFYVPERVRFRDDGEIFIVNPRWGNSITIEKSLAIFLKNAQENKKFFSLKDIGNDRKNWLANLYFKDIIESNDLKLKKIITGLSIDLTHLPKLKNKNGTNKTKTITRS